MRGCVFARIIILVLKNDQEEWAWHGARSTYLCSAPRWALAPRTLLASLEVFIKIQPPQSIDQPPRRLPLPAGKFTYIQQRESGPVGLWGPVIVDPRDSGWIGVLHLTNKTAELSAFFHALKLINSFTSNTDPRKDYNLHPQWERMLRPIVRRQLHQRTL